MSTVAKFLVGLALILPMTGYVVGSLVSTSAGEPDRRDPVIVNDVRQVPPPGDTSAPAPGQGTDDADDTGAGGSGGEDDDDRDIDQNGMTVVKPEPTRPDDRDDNGDDDGDDDRDRDGGDDDRDDRTDTDDGGDD